jgi:hypothetical protein
MPFIRPNDSVASPKVHVFLDCEAYDPDGPDPDGRQALRLRCWCASAVTFCRGEPVKRRTAEGICRESFWRWIGGLTSLNYSVWLWAHNAFVDATWIGLWEEIDKGEVTLEPSALGGSSFQVNSLLRGRGLKWVDSFGWFRCSLKVMGESIGLLKYEMPPESAPITEWLAYCTRDVIVLERSVTELIRWVRSNDLGQLRPTAPGQAWHSWRHLNNGPFPFVHQNPELSAFERRAHYGGRVKLGFRGTVTAETSGPFFQECFERERGPALMNTRAHLWDVSACYPAVMRNNRFPCRHRYGLPSSSPDMLRRVLYRTAAVAEVKIKSDSRPYPRRKGGITLYARGEFWTTLCGPELVAALNLGDVAAVGRVEAYEDAALFISWADRMWALRERCADNPVWTGLCKILMNSLYGKFAQRESGWVDLPGHRPPRGMRWGPWIDMERPGGFGPLMRAIGGRVQARTVAGDAKHAFPAIAAYCTSYARVACQEIMDGLPPQTLLYHDTDSFHVTDQGHEHLQARDNPAHVGPGRLRHRGSYPEAEYWCPKAYRIGEEVHVAGLPTAAKQSAGGGWTFTEWERVQSLLTRGPDGTVRLREKSVRLAASHLPGVAGHDGWIDDPVIDDPVRPGPEPEESSPAPDPDD